MKRLLFDTLLLLIVIPSIAFAEGDNGKRKPIVILMEGHPYLLEERRSDSPTFALYDDGLVIFMKVKKQRGEYFSAVLDPKTQKRFLESLPIGQPFSALQDHYQASDWSDQPSNELYVWNGDKVKRVSVYGEIRELKEEVSAEHLRTNREARLKTPPAFLQIFDALVSYENEKALPWFPKKVEVWLGPYEDSPEEFLVWPEGWPDTKHPETRQVRIGDFKTYRLFLDSGYFEAFKKLVYRLDHEDRRALLVNGEKWYISSYRFPFPSEESWE